MAGKKTQKPRTDTVCELRSILPKACYRRLSRTKQKVAVIKAVKEYRMRGLHGMRTIYPIVSLSGTHHRVKVSVEEDDMLCDTCAETSKQYDVSSHGSDEFVVRVSNDGSILGVLDLVRPSNNATADMLIEDCGHDDSEFDPEFHHFMNSA